MYPANLLVRFIFPSASSSGKGTLEASLEVFWHHSQSCQLGTPVRVELNYFSLCSRLLLLSCVVEVQLKGNLLQLLQVSLQSVTDTRLSKLSSNAPPYFEKIFIFTFLSQKRHRLVAAGAARVCLA